MALPGKDALPIVILKADDIKCEAEGALHARWQRFFDSVASRGLKASAGVVGNSLEGEKDEYFSQLKSLHRGGQIEFWNHGYTHQLDSESNIHEFKNSGYEGQFDNLRKTQTLAKSKLGITFTTFGAPGNAIDDDTGRAIEAFPEIEIWFFGMPGRRNGEIFVLERGKTNIEYPCHNPDFESFQKDFNNEEHRSYLVLQGHPLSWDDRRFNEFERILDYLVGLGVRFETPMGYYRSIKQVGTD